jgi:hypothetical protein
VAPFSARFFFGTISFEVSVPSHEFRSRDPLKAKLRLSLIVGPIAVTPAWPALKYIQTTKLLRDATIEKAYSDVGRAFGAPME